MIGATKTESSVPKNASTGSNLQDPSDKSKLRDVSQNNYSVIFKRSMSSKTKNEFPD